MTLLGAIRSYFVWLVEAFGVLLLLLSTVLSGLGSQIIPVEPETLQTMGLVLFIAGILTQTFFYQMQMNRQKAASARLLLDGTRTIWKPVFQGGNKIGEFRFLTVDFANTPYDWENAKTAINATAEVRFWRDGVEVSRVQFARWADKDVPLFPQNIEDIKSLKQVTIDPGHPESLVLGYRKARGAVFHGFYYTDHKQITDVSTRRRIGSPPIRAVICLRGGFMPTRFEIEITRGHDNAFAVREIRRRRLWSYWPGLRVMPETFRDVTVLD